MALLYAKSPPAWQAGGAGRALHPLDPSGIPHGSCPEPSPPASPGPPGLRQQRLGLDFAEETGVGLLEASMPSPLQSHRTHPRLPSFFLFNLRGKRAAPSPVGGDPFLWVLNPILPCLLQGFTSSRKNAWLQLPCFSPKPPCS